MADNFFKIQRGTSLSPRASAPSNPTNGDIYYDSTLNTFRLYQNGNWVSGTVAATALDLVLRDVNANAEANNFVTNLTSTPTATGTTTLTAASAYFQQFTGSLGQTVVLPNATTLTVGQAFTIANRSTATITVNMNGGSLLQSITANSQAILTVTNISTSTGTWDISYPAAGAVENLQRQFITTGTTWTTPSTITSTTIFKITLIGGGGGGGGAQGTYAAGCGGTSAAVGIVWLSGLSPSTAYPISIGAGGAAGGSVGPTAGGGGGTTSITIGATTHSAGGGFGGPKSSFTAPNYIMNQTVATCSNVDVEIGGSPPSPVYYVQSGNAPGSNGGSCSFGSGGNGSNVGNTGGSNGVGWGGGGGGANSGSGAAYAGFYGAQGAILIEWAA